MRFMASYDVAGTKSYRLSSRKLFGDYGGNAQNIPEEIRSYLIADPGKVIWQVDQSGAEAYVLAFLARDGNYRQLFKLGIKPYIYVALNLFTDKFRGKFPRDRYQFRTPQELAALPEWPELNKVIKNSEVEYKLGKLVCLAKGYDMKAPTFRLNTLQKSSGLIVLSLEESTRFLRTYDMLFPEILEWQADIETTVSNGRILYNLFGYPRLFAGRWCSELVREAYSFVPQSTVGCLTSIAASELQEETERCTWDNDLLANVHDALVGQCLVEIVQQVTDYVKQSFARTLVTPSGESFNMKSEAMYGPTWAKKDMKELK